MIKDIILVGADDEAGLLPEDLKRGVLSEDAVWNLLKDHKELQTRMRELSNHDRRD